MKIQTTTVQQTANEILGVEAKNLYYLIIENNAGNKLIINVGKKTHENVQKMIDSETAIQETKTEDINTQQTEVEKLTELENKIEKQLNNKNKK